MEIYAIMRKIGKKGYVQFKTTAGDINLEVGPDEASAPIPKKHSSKQYQPETDTLDPKHSSKQYQPETDGLGRILKQVRCDCTPMTAENFLTLCKRGYYNGTIFHRLVSLLRKSRIRCPFRLFFRLWRRYPYPQKVLLRGGNFGSRAGVDGPHAIFPAARVCFSAMNDWVTAMTAVFRKGEPPRCRKGDQVVLHR